MIMMKKVTLESCGQVMFQNRCHGLAPSMSAASYSSCGTPERPARYSSILFEPIAPQNPISSKEGLAQ